MSSVLPIERGDPQFMCLDCNLFFLYRFENGTDVEERKKIVTVKIGLTLLHSLNVDGQISSFRPETVIW